MEKKKTSYKLLSIDLDGTLLSPVLKTASKEDCLAIQEYMSLGGYAFINTGRAPWAITKTIWKINKSGPNRLKLLSCFNGAYILDLSDGQALETKISHEYCTILLNIIKKFKSVTGVFYTSRCFSSNAAEVYPNNVLIKTFYQTAKLKKIKDLKDLTSFKVNVISSSTKAIAQIYHEMRKQNLHQIMSISHSSPRFLEITANGINKGFAIKFFAKKYGILPEEIASVGDSFNDETAFNESALSIGINPKNPFFLKICDRIINHKTNGVTEAINTYIIKQGVANDYIKLVFSDLDGTLIDSKTKLYSAKTKLALQQCTNHLIPLAIASGRGIFDGINIVSEMKLNPKTNIYIVGNNGATIYDIYTKKYISQTPISEEDAKKVFDYIVNLNKTTEKNQVGLIIHPHDPDLIFYNPTFWKPLNFKKTGSEDRYDPWVKTLPIYVNKYPKDIICYKFVIKFSTTEKAHAYCKKLQRVFPNLEICMSSSVNIEVNHKNVNKAFAAKKIAKVTNVNIDEILILGDGQNDIPALRLNKNTYAPIYAPSYVRKEAAHVIKNVDASNFASEVMYNKVFKVKEVKKHGK